MTAYRSPAGTPARRLEVAIGEALDALAQADTVMDEMRGSLRVKDAGAKVVVAETVLKSALDDLFGD